MLHQYLQDNYPFSKHYCWVGFILGREFIKHHLSHCKPKINEGLKYVITKEGDQKERLCPMNYALQGEMPLPHSRSGILKSHLINVTGFSLPIMFNPKIMSCMIAIFIWILKEKPLDSKDRLITY